MLKNIESENLSEDETSNQNDTSNDCDIVNDDNDDDDNEQNDDDNKPLLPVTFRTTYKLIDSPKKALEDDWGVMGRKRLAALNDVTNVVFKKAKSNPRL